MRACRGLESKLALGKRGQWVCCHLVVQSCSTLLQFHGL